MRPNLALSISALALLIACGDDDETMTDATVDAVLVVDARSDSAGDARLDAEAPDGVVPDGDVVPDADVSVDATPDGDASADDAATEDATLDDASTDDASTDDADAGDAEPPPVCADGTFGTCEGELECLCCPGGGPTQRCQCTTSCSSHFQCTDPARPRCNLPGAIGGGGPGLCTATDFVCAWGSD